MRLCFGVTLAVLLVLGGMRPGFAADDIPAWMNFRADGSLYGNVGRWLVSVNELTGFKVLVLSPDVRATRKLAKQTDTMLIDPLQVVIHCTNDAPISLALTRPQRGYVVLQEEKNLIAINSTVKIASYTIASSSVSEVKSYQKGSTPEFGSLSIMGFNIKDGTTILKQIYENESEAMQIASAHLGVVFHHSSYRLSGFTEAFDFACGTHKEYPAISSKLARKVKRLTLKDQLDQMEAKISPPSLVGRLKRKVDGIDAAALKTAIEKQNEKEVKRILEANHNVLMGFAYVDHDAVDAPYLLSLKSGSAQIVQLLLDAGANPNQINDGDDTIRQTPLEIALKNAELDVVQTLIDAGASVRFDSSRYADTSPLFAAIASGDTAKLTLILEHGATLGERTFYDWTPLMHAIWLEDQAMIDYLLPLSDPFIQTDGARKNLKLLTGEELENYPTVNALFLARRVNKIDADSLVESVLKRAADVGDANAIHQMHLQTWQSEGLLASYEGRSDDAMSAFAEAIKLADVLNLTAVSDGPVIMAAMESLLYKHQQSLISNTEFSEADRLAVAHISSIGGWNQPVHDLLDVFNVAMQFDSDTELGDWIEQYGDPALYAWDASSIRVWIDSQENPLTKDRLETLLAKFVIAQ